MQALNEKERCEMRERMRTEEGGALGERKSK